ncbi:MAG: hypothetical protein ACPL7K_01460 [Armatimonadota bacterium]
MYGDRFWCPEKLTVSPPSAPSHGDNDTSAIRSGNSEAMQGGFSTRQVVAIGAYKSAIRQTQPVRLQGLLFDGSGRSIPYTVYGT